MTTDKGSRVNRTGVALAALLLLAVIGCGTSSAHVSSLGLPTRALPASLRSHIAIIVMENKENSDVIGSPNSPYVNSLVARYGYASSSYAITHPSLPNYLALTSGTTSGITSDCMSCSVRARNLGDQLTGARISWKAYMQDSPHAGRCVMGDHGLYAQRHNPFVYFRGDRALCRHLSNFAGLKTDLRRGALPTFVWITPNTCADTHDCAVASGDAFLRSLVPPLLREIGPHGYIVLTWDEGSSNAGYGVAHGGHVATIVIGPSVRHGARMTARIDHYGVLATIERSLRLPLLANAARKDSGSLRPLFATPPTLR